MTTNGGKRAGAGRPKGSSSKKNLVLKDFLGTFLEEEKDNLRNAMKELYETDKKAYLDNYNKFLEYTMPKMARIEQSTRFVDEEGNDLTAKDMEIIGNYKVKLLNGAKQDDRNTIELITDGRRAEDRIQ